MPKRLGCATLWASSLVFAQSSSSPAFEVASIRPSHADLSSVSGIYSGHGRLTAMNVTLKRCIMGAYAVGPNQISSGPEWLDSDRFEITAKAEQSVGDHDLMVMLQTLLAERFKLALHREPRPIEAYILEVWKNGHKLESSNGGGSKTDNGKGNISAINATMDRFAEILSRQMDLPVINHSGLDGVFNVRLHWVPENAKPTTAPDTISTEGPSIFTAVQEQLGLHLRAGKTPVNVLVIDHAEWPSEN